MTVRSARTRRVRALPSLGPRATGESITEIDECADHSRELERAFIENRQTDRDILTLGFITVKYVAHKHISPALRKGRLPVRLSCLHVVERFVRGGNNGPHFVAHRNPE